MTKPSAGSSYDVVIAGGGLAGATLARQLRLEAPSVRVLIIEKRQHPVREAAFKVGESTVEIGAHYFAKRLDLDAHLRSSQLEKLGLRYFFTRGDNRDIAARFELGPPTFPPVPSFQVDRGRLENHLLAEERKAGVEVLDGCRVDHITLGAEVHELSLAGPHGPRVVTAGWLVDASGRAGLLKRQLGLARPSSHGANACWFRIRSRLRVDDWSNDVSWKARVPNQLRWMSTVHLMGRGYWVWLIPLGSGSTSVGIVADGDLHPFNRINRYERALQWLNEYEPQCARVLDGRSGEVEDFLALQHYAHACERVFSPDRWTLVGEAGVFTDPFYSPGSDFIAMGNDYTVDLIVRRLAGEDITARADLFNTTYLRLFDAFIRLYDNQYRIMGNAQVMTAKVAWDNACYWSVTALLFFQRRLTQPAFIASIDPLMRRFFVLHARMQQFFRAWDLIDEGDYAAGAANVVDVAWLRNLQASLGDPPMDDEPLRQRLTRGVGQLESFGRAWQSMARDRHPSMSRVLSGDDEAAPVDLQALTLSPASVSR